MASIDLDNVSLTFRVTERGPVQLTDWLRQRLRQNRSKSIQTVYAVRNVSLSLRDGDRVGLVGRNGSGKSTLLRILAGIYPVDSGRIETNGRIDSMLTLMNGLEGYATGWENIRNREVLHGRNGRISSSHHREIARFSGLGSHLRRPIANYSLGMKVRLGFGIATARDPEILLMDECVNAGDLAFRERARRRLESLVERSSILVVATHDHGLLRTLCRTVVWMDRGEVKMVGQPDDVINEFEGCMLAA